MIRKIHLILHKNILLKFRHKKLTFCEIVFPILFFSSLLILRIVPNYELVIQPNVTQFEPVTRTLLFAMNLPYIMEKTAILYYAPKTNFTDLLMEKISEKMGMVNKVAGFDTEKELEYQNSIDMLDPSGNQDRNDCLGGIVFLFQPKDGKIPLNITYKIRTKGYWQTNYPFSLLDNEGPRTYTMYYGYNRMFIQLQISIDVVLTSMIQEQNKPITDGTQSFFWDSLPIEKYSIQKFPYPPFVNDNGVNQFFSFLIPSLMISSFFLIVPSIHTCIVREKMTGVKELMRMMGMSRATYWVTWTITNLVVVLYLAILMTIILKVDFISSAPAILQKSDGFIIFLFIISFGMAFLMFCHFTTTFFDKPPFTIVTATFLLAFFLTLNNNGFQLMTPQTMDFTRQLILLICLLPCSTPLIAFRIIGIMEKSIGISWNNIDYLPTSYDRVSLADLMAMNIVASILFCLATIYLDHVKPGRYGVAESVIFPFKLSYWKAVCGISETPVMDTAVPCIPTHGFEVEPNRPIGIGVQTITKQYVQYKATKLALKGVTFNVYHGQITPLLGHNGAGKSTLMSILTGIISPSSGDAIIMGFSIKNGMTDIRKHLGLCPQHSMLFHEMSVEEHLMLFCRLKGKSFLEAKEQTSHYIRRLKLEDKRNTLSCDLSGGMKRRLSLGIALIGGSKILILDEPSSGLDPELRRELWDLLKEEKSHRTILMSTHFLEEADVLGDRIIIMNSGRIICSGSPMFLKQHYGKGYNLEVSIKDKRFKDGLDCIVQFQIEGTEITENFRGEICYSLPYSERANFPKLLQFLDENKDYLGINSYTVSLTSLDEIFSKSLIDEDSKAHEAPLTRKKYYRGSTSSLDRLTEKHEESSQEKNVGVYLIWQQFYSLTVKNLTESLRHWYVTLLQILLPGILIILGSTINSFVSDRMYLNTPLVLDLESIPGQTYNLYSSTLPKNDVMETNYQMLFQDQDHVNKVDDVQKSLLEMGEKNIEKYRKNCIIGAEMKKVKDKYHFNVMHNTIALNAPGIAVNYLDQAFMRAFTGKNYSLNTINHPLNNAAKLLPDGVLQSTVIQLVFSSLLTMALSIITSLVLIPPIRERLGGAKLLQQMTGVPVSLYWLSFLLVDGFILSLSALVMISLFYIMDFDGYFLSDFYGIFYLQTVMGAVAGTVFSYLFSFAFKSIGTSFTIVSIINSISGVVMMYITSSFKTTGTRGLMIASKVLSSIFSLVPIFSTSKAYQKSITIGQLNSICQRTPKSTLDIFCPFININTTDQMQATFLSCCPTQYCYPIGGPNVCAGSKTYWDFSEDGFSIYMLSLFFDSILYFTVIILIDSKVILKMWQLIKSHFPAKSPLPTPSLLDADVMKEYYRIDKMLNDESYSQNILTIDKLTKTFGDTTAVNNLRFAVRPKECFGLLGVNGAGKSTTFKMLTGDIPATSGDFYLNSYSFTKNKSRVLSQIGYCPQFDGHIDCLTGRELLTLFARLRGVKEEHILSSVNELIISLDLQNHSERKCGTYSGGNKRKLSTAIAIIGRPPVVFLDEPTAGVDPVARIKFWEAFSKFKLEGQSFILTSHSINEVGSLCDRIAIMMNGEFHCIGPTQYLQNKFCQGFSVHIKLSPQEDGHHVVKNAISEAIPRIRLDEEHETMLKFHLKDSCKIPVWQLFLAFENLKEKHCEIETFAIGCTNLEDVFLDFAAKKSEEETTNL